MDQSSAQILLQSLEKKNVLLDQMISLNSEQEVILKREEFDMDAFDEAINRQSACLEELDKLDHGFEAVYDRVREELMQNKERYRTEIAGMKEQIQQITDKIVTINAGNMRNKMLAENQFKRKQLAIGSGISKNKAASNYYNSMNNLNYVSPQFYDSKK